MFSQDPCLGSVVDLESLREPSGLDRVEGLVQGTERVSIEVVHDQHDLLGLGIVGGRRAGRLRVPNRYGSGAAGRSHAGGTQGLP